MTNVTTLPEREKLHIGSQHQRLFYLGFVYRGPPLMQEVQDVYLKRHRRKEGTRRWSIITYAKYFEWDVRSYSLELANCEEDDVPDMIDEWYKPDEVTFEDLWEMGWDGDVSFVLIENKEKWRKNARDLSKSMASLGYRLREE